MCLSKNATAHTTHDQTSHYNRLLLLDGAYNFPSKRLKSRPIHIPIRLSIGLYSPTAHTTVVMMNTEVYYQNPSLCVGIFAIILFKLLNYPN